MCLLEQVDMYYVKQACWIISNITARKEEHIKVSAELVNQQHEDASYFNSEIFPRYFFSFVCNFFFTARI